MQGGTGTATRGKQKPAKQNGDDDKHETHATKKHNSGGKNDDTHNNGRCTTDKHRTTKVLM